MLHKVDLSFLSLSIKCFKCSASNETCLKQFLGVQLAFFSPLCSLEMETDLI